MERESKPGVPSRLLPAVGLRNWLRRPGFSTDGAWIGWIVVLGVLGGSLIGQDLTAPGVLRSRSGQFVVTRAPGTSPVLARPSAEGSTDRAWVDLEPATLVLTCERVRQALLTELRQPDVWQGRIYVVIDAQLATNSPALIGAQYFKQGWHYRLELPPGLEPAKLVRGLTQVLLMEFANRTHPARSAEVPLWLSEGLTQHILHSALVDLVVRPPVAGEGRLPVRQTSEEQVGYDPLSPARERLRTHAALSFSRMAEITGEDLASETWETFQASAHLFMDRLLQVTGARVSLARMLTELPYDLNWQTAFFNNFRPFFVRLLDVEKWWSVVLVQFTGHDPLNSWNTDTALKKLDGILSVPVLLSDNREGLARRRKVTLQELLQNWDFLSQQSLVQGVIQQLQACRFKMPTETLGLADDYRRVLEEYLARRSQAGRARSLPGLPSTTADLLVGDACKKLDRLDEQRQAFRTGARPPPNEDAPSK